MKIVFYSQTGNVKRFVQKLKWDNANIINLAEEQPQMTEDFVIVTGTTNFGDTPGIVLSFLDQNRQYLRAVAASGNRNWGDLFAKAADNIATQYNIPILVKFELSGFAKDVETFITGVENIEISRIK